MLWTVMHATHIWYKYYMIRYDTINMHYNFTSRQSSQITISPHGPITHNFKNNFWMQLKAKTVEHIWSTKNNTKTWTKLSIITLHTMSLCTDVVHRQERTDNLTFPATHQDAGKSLAPSAWIHRWEELKIYGKCKICMCCVKLEIVNAFATEINTKSHFFCCWLLQHLSIPTHLFCCLYQCIWGPFVLCCTNVLVNSSYYYVWWRWPVQVFRFKEHCWKK